MLGVNKRNEVQLTWYLITQSKGQYKELYTGS